MKAKSFFLICVLPFTIYGILYLFKIKVGLLLLILIISPMVLCTIFVPILIILYLATFLYNTIFRRKVDKIRVKDLLLKVNELRALVIIGTIVVFMPLVISFMELSGMYQRLLYYRCKEVLAEVPFNFPENIMNTSGEAFSEAIHIYGNSEQRCFYFDLQWSIRHSKSQEEKEKYQALEKRFLQSGSCFLPQQILAYNLHEALLADSRDSILYYFKELHPGNIYNTNIYFTRISRTRKLVTATEEQEYDMASGNVQPGTGARRYGLSPRPLSQAVVNATCFSMEEKTKMITYIVKCYMELAEYNKCPENYIRDFYSKIFVESNKTYHISYIHGVWTGSSSIEDKISELKEQMRESNDDWIAIYTPENWTQFSF